MYISYEDMFIEEEMYGITSTSKVDYDNIYEYDDFGGIFEIGSDNEEKLKGGILKAMEFETLYLKNKCEYYDRMAKEDQARLKMMAERLEIAGSDLKL